MTGINAGRVGTTAGDGGYSITQLRAGAGGVRAYGPEHGVVERALTVTADTTADFVLGRAIRPAARPPFTYAGIVWDSLGTPVTGAAVSMIRDSGANPLAIVTSGGDGAFVVTTQTTANVVRVTRDGYVQIENPAPLALESLTVVNVAIPRIVGYQVQPVGTLRVGSTAQVMTEVATDDGLRSTGQFYASLISSNGGVAAIEGGQVIARAPGTATITAMYYGVTATLAVSVVQ